MYIGVKKHIELPKCFSFSILAACAICSRYGSAAGDKSAAKSSGVRLTAFIAFSTSLAVYLS